VVVLLYKSIKPWFTEPNPCVKVTAYKRNWTSWELLLRKIHWAFKPTTKICKLYDKPVSTALLPYIHAMYNCLRCLLSRHNIKSGALPPKKICGFLWLVKDAIGFKTPGVYSMPCKCARVYNGQTGRSTDIRIKKHEHNIRLLQLDKSALVEHGFSHDH
jgi:hypothetical protein